MFNVIVNKFIDVRNKIKTVDGKWIDQTKHQEKDMVLTKLRDDINERSEKVIYENWENPIIIDAIEFGSLNNTTLLIRVNETDDSSYNNQIFHIVTENGRLLLTKLSLSNNKHCYMESVTQTTGFKMYLKQPIHLPAGCKISAYGLEAGTYTCYIKLREVIS
jgi:hypothetical protein